MKRALRVLLVADVSAQTVRGGAERMLINHVRALREAGFAVTLLTRQPDPDAPLRIEVADGVEEHRLIFSGDRGWQGLRQLSRQAKRWWNLRANAFDVVISEQPFVMWALLGAGCTLPRLQICHSLACEEYATRHGLAWGLRARLVTASMRRLERRIYRSADRVMALSSFTRERLRRVMGVLPEQVVIVPGGVDLSRRAKIATRQQWRQQLGWDGPVVVTLRNLVPRTGVDLLVQTAAILQHTHPDLRWCVMGDGELAEPLRHLCGMLGVEESIEWCGFLEDNEVGKRLQAADLFVLPTRSLEGFGLVTLEANSHGLPVVATPVDANVEVVPQIDGNRLAVAATPQSLAREVAAALQGWPPQDSQHQRQRMRQQVEQRFGWPHHDQALLDSVRELVPQLVPQVAPE
ncbi:MAG: glycosyltransferase family 4 protein [Mariprofundales bacterium]|nr:glycosyltransferase family 4 protein [Mariprofundales bacterium]